jgi:hypothetical protein
MPAALKHHWPEYLKAGRCFRDPTVEEATSGERNSTRACRMT